VIDEFLEDGRHGSERERSRGEVSGRCIRTDEPRELVAVARREPRRDLVPVCFDVV